MKRYGSSVRDLAVVLSLANLCLLRMWTSVLCPPALVRTQHAAAIATVVSLALVLWSVARVVRWSGSAILLAVVRGLLVLAVLTCLPSIVRAISPAVETTSWFVPVRAALFALFVAAVIAASVLRKGPVVSAATCRVLLALLPAAAVTIGQSARETMALSRRVAVARAAPPVEAAGAATTTAGRARTRVVALLLDELDYYLAFVARPSSVELPALDRFRREAVWASQAYPPHCDTRTSVPSSLTGRLVEDARANAAGGLDIRFMGTQKPVPWREQRTVCTVLREEGMRSVIVGHVLPYEWVLSQDAHCIDGRSRGPARERLAREMVGQLLCVADDSPIPIPGYLQRIRNRLSVQDVVGHHHAFTEAAMKHAANPAAHFTFMHSLVPHVPYIYDRATGEITTAPGKTYLDNLVLADRTFARVRAAMEAAGEWDATAVVVFADHWWRRRPASLGPPDHRVPFAIKMPGQQTGTEYAAPINTLLLHDLVLALLREELRQPVDVARWLDRNRTFG